MSPRGLCIPILIISLSMLHILHFTHSKSLSFYTSGIRQGTIRSNHAQHWWWEPPGEKKPSTNPGTNLEALTKYVAGAVCFLSNGWKNEGLRVGIQPKLKMWGPPGGHWEALLGDHTQQEITKSKGWNMYIIHSIYTMYIYIIHSILHISIYHIHYMYIFIN